MLNHVRFVLGAGVLLFLGAVVDSLTGTVPWWAWPTAASVCLLGVLLTYIPRLIRLVRIDVGEDSAGEVAKGAFGVFMTLTITAGVGYLIVLAIEAPSYVWRHPTMSLEEQTKMVADCEMQAYEAVGGAAMKSMARRDYWVACVTKEGFIKEIEDN